MGLRRFWTGPPPWYSVYLSEEHGVRSLTSAVAAAATDLVSYAWPSPPSFFPAYRPQPHLTPKASEELKGDRGFAFGKNCDHAQESIFKLCESLIFGRTTPEELTSSQFSSTAWPVSTWPDVIVSANRTTIFLRAKLH